MTHTRFDVCLARVLQLETGYPQRAGGPFVRFKDGRTYHRTNAAGAFVLPAEPDGMAFDDDPNDTGGRTCMGLLQREYDGWRRQMRLQPRDVWLIEDHEVAALYHQQYWRAMRCDELPAGIDWLLFDAGVNCGVGTGARLLQRALGIRDDGHIGAVTISAAHAVEDLAAFAAQFRAHRETYYRACKTWRHHGAGWMRRSANANRMVANDVPVSKPAAPATDQAVMLTGASAAVAESEWQVEVAEAAEGSRRATPPDRAETVLDTATGRVQAAQIGTGGGLSLMQGLELAERVERMGTAQALLQSPVTIVLIVAGIVIACGGVWQLRDRARKLILGV